MLCQFATVTRYWTPAPPVNVNGVKPVAMVTPFELTVVHMPLNCLPLRSTDMTVNVAVGIAGVEVVVVVVEVVVVVVNVEERQAWIHASSSRCFTIPLKFSALASAQY